MGGAGGEGQAAAAVAEPVRAAPPLKIFISYRHADSGGWAMALRQELVKRFGEENVFLDVVSLQPGKKWLDGLRQGTSECGAFIALVGPRWEAMIDERGGPGSEADYVRAEIEAALRREGGVEVIVALVDHASPPRKERIPRTLSPLLAAHKFEELRPSDWQADVEKLIARLEGISHEETHEVVTRKKRRRRRADAVAVSPGPAHYDQVVEWLQDLDSSLIFFIGPGANSCDRDEAWRDLESSYLPDADELAAYLARKLPVNAKQSGLARVAQYVYEIEGQGDLYKTLRQTLTNQCPPGSVHRFLAQLPRELRRHGERYQLIITTNYDDALERAFEEAGQKYDLVVYMASGDDAGKFVHFPIEGGHVPIDTIDYMQLPITHSGALKRPIIVKIHGAADGEIHGVADDGRDTYRWEQNYVVTEDDYIDYLPQGAVVPAQVRKKLNYDHLLFLGYSVRDWNLRVFLQRIFGQTVPNPSCAIQPAPDILDKKFWNNMAVNELFAVDLPEYVETLRQHISSG